jgi:peptidoglycan/LPS O-acetylase OafA/YrhL
VTARLGELTIGRGNNVLPLRYVAAAGVMVFHSFTFSGRVGDDPLLRMFPPLNSGSLGIKVFFLLSGFLVTKSYLERGGLVPFVVARVLRIYPALIAATLFSIGVAAFVTAVPLRDFFSHPLTIRYLWSNALGWKIAFELPGAFATNPFPGGVNGSLWTIPVELRLYAVVALLGVAGLLARRWRYVAFVVLALALAFALPDLFLADADTLVRELVALFMLGSLAWVFRDAIPMSLPVAIAGVVAIAWNPGGVVRG